MIARVAGRAVGFPSKLAGEIIALHKLPGKKPSTA